MAKNTWEKQFNLYGTANCYEAYKANRKNGEGSSSIANGAASSGVEGTWTTRQVDAMIDAYARSINDNK